MIENESVPADTRWSLLDALGPDKHFVLTVNGYETTFQILSELGRGSNCIAYKALQGKRVVCIKEFYPYSYKKGADTLAQPINKYLLRIGTDIVKVTDIPEDVGRYIDALYADAFKQDNQTSFALQQLGDESTLESLNNDPNYFWSEIAEYRGSEGALNRYLITDTHAGKTLNEIELHGKGRERVIDALGVCYEILRAAKKLHHRNDSTETSAAANGYLHMDLKPENIFVSQLSTKDGEKMANHIVLLIDFGSSHEMVNGRLLKEDGLPLSASNGYAPGEVRDKHYEAIGQHSDIFSITKILRELLYSDVPPERIHSTSIGGDYGKLELTESQSMLALYQTERDKIQEILDRGLEESIAKRYQTADEMMKDIEEAVNLLLNKGITKWNMRKNAEILAMREDFAGYIIPELLPQVHKVQPA
jgi:serine/threonine protein kinase